MRAFILFLMVLGVAQAPLRAQLPTITNQPASQTVWAGGNAVFMVGVSGTGPFAYRWQLNLTNNLPNNISTVAGNTNKAYSGDGGAATNASFNNPSGVSVDASGDLFIADYNNNRIREVDTNGIVRTVAGNGSKSYSGDGGVATNASLNNPRSVAADAAGNLFIADYNNQRIRKVDTNGIITTVAGNGAISFSGDGGPATNASLNSPSGVAVDAAGNLFVADSDNQRIRKVDTNGIITTMAGNGTLGYSGDGGPATNANFNFPVDVAVDAAGNLFVADNSNFRIRKVDTNGIITTVAGNGTFGCSGDGGAATNASLVHPFGVAVDAYGNLFFADSNINISNRIRMVDADGIINTAAGNNTKGYSGDGGLATKASLNFPHGVAVDASDNLFIADYNNNCIRKVTARQATLALTNLAATDAGDYQVVVAGPGGSVTSSNAILTVGTVDIQPASRAYVSGATVSLFAAVGGINSQAYQWQKNGVNLTDGGNVSGSTTDNLTLSNVQAADAASYMVVVTNDVVGSVTSSPAMLLVITAPQASQAVWVGSVITLAPVAGAGPFTYRWQLNSTNLPAIITTVAGNGNAASSGDGGPATAASLAIPRGVAVDAAGDLFIADTDGQRIRKVDTNGIITTVAGNGEFKYSGEGGAATNATLDTPTGVALDAFGNLFIMDSNNERVRMLDTNGIITTVAGNGAVNYSGDGGPAINASFDSPQNVSVDPFGNVFIADTINQRVRRVDTNGIITLAAGNGQTGFSGDSGQATNAALHRPWGMVRDAAGTLFIADAENNRIRKVNASGIISTVAGTGTLGFSGDGGQATNAMLHAPPTVVEDPVGRLLFPDFGNNRIRVVDTNGVINTVVGNGTQSYAGDGGPATNAELNNPYGLARDAAGDLFIADSNNNRIRKVTNTQQSSLALINATALDTGDYQLVVAGPGGSVTSSIVNLIVATSPLIYRTALNPDSSVVLNFVSMPGSTNVVLCATNLVPPVVWLSISTNFAGVNGDWQFTDTNTAACPTRFYRSLTQ